MNKELYSFTWGVGAPAYDGVGDYTYLVIGRPLYDPRNKIIVHDRVKRADPRDSFGILDVDEVERGVIFKNPATMRELAWKMRSVYTGFINDQYEPMLKELDEFSSHLTTTETQVRRKRKIIF